MRTTEHAWLDRIRQVADLRRIAADRLHELIGAPRTPELWVTAPRGRRAAVILHGVLVEYTHPVDPLGVTAAGSIQFTALGSRSARFEELYLGGGWAKKTKQEACRAFVACLDELQEASE